MNKREKVTVYAGGEVRQVTVGYLLKSQLRNRGASKKKNAGRR